MGFVAVTLMLSKQRNHLLIHKRGDVLVYLGKMSPKFIKALWRPPSTPITRNWDNCMYCFLLKNSLKILHCASFIRLGVDNDLSRVKRGRWNKNVWETLD